MPRIVIDNTSPQFVFDDSSRLSDGVAQLFNSLVRTPVDVANIRQQQQQQQHAQAFQQQQWQHTLDQDAAAQQYRQQQSDRQWNNDLLGQAWHEAEFDRSKANDAAAQKRYEEESSRKWAEDLGHGALNIGKVFGLGQPATSLRNAGTGWHQSQDGRFFRTSADGVLEVWDPETKQVQRMTGAPGAGGPQAPPVQLQAPPQPLNQGFAPSLRRSGYSGVHTIGDILGGIRDLWHGETPPEQVGGQQPAPAAAPTKVVDAQTLQQYAQKHGMDLASAAAYLTQQGYAVQAPPQ